MKIKFNWGTGIILVIILFFGTIALRVHLSYQQELNLVSEDYYPKEIRYQEQIDKEKNTAKLEHKPRIKLTDKELLVQFPENFRDQKNIGTIHVYRPSDANLDEIHDLKLNSEMEQRIDASKFIHGKYLIKLEWASNDIEYYIQKEIFVFEK